MTRKLISLVFVALLVAAPGAAQPHPSHGTPALTMAVLQRQIGLRSGVGLAHDAVASLPPLAQQYYDQGLALLHNYVWIDAARSFSEVLRLSPGHVMGSIGLSYAYEGLNMRTVARETVASARRAARNEPHEAAHLRIRELDLAAQQPGAPRAAGAAYRAALDEAITALPGDVELLLMRGVAASDVPGDRGQGSHAGSVPFYQAALRAAPLSFAAHHYLTHAYENTGEVARALESAQRYAERAAAIPHAHHMLAHNLRRVGRIKEAIAEFEAADRAEQRSFDVDGIVPATDWHFEHNLDLLGTSYQYTGQVRKAAATLRAGFDLPTTNLVQAVNKRQWPLMLRLLGRTDEAFAAGLVLSTYPHPVVQAIGHIEVAHVWLARREPSKAVTSANAAAAALRNVAGAALADVPLRVLQGELLLRSGQADKGRPMLDEAIRRARALRGPDEWSQALFMMEAIASAARDASAWDLAASAAANMLAHDASYGGTHLALALVAQHNGDRQTARREAQEAKTLWSDADPDFPPLRTIDAIIRTR